MPIGVTKSNKVYTICCADCCSATYKRDNYNSKYFASHRSLRVLAKKNFASENFTAQQKKLLASCKYLQPWSLQFLPLSKFTKYGAALLLLLKSSELINKGGVRIEGETRVRFVELPLHRAQKSKFVAIPQSQSVTQMYHLFETMKIYSLTIHELLDSKQGTEQNAQHQ